METLCETGNASGLKDVIAMSIAEADGNDENEVDEAFEEDNEEVNESKDEANQQPVQPEKGGNPVPYNINEISENNDEKPVYYDINEI